MQVVASTHRDLDAEVARGAYRQDLYYRLKVVELVVPPLRERLEDLPALVDRFLERIAARLGRDKRSVSPEAMASLASHAWPGNVRELRHAIEQAAVLASGTEIGVDDLPIASHAGSASASASGRPSGSFSEAKRNAVDAFERAFLIDALKRHNGNISQTAEAIGMVRQSLQQKLKELGLRGS